MTEQTVLIIDDSGTVRSHVKDILEAGGSYRVLAAKDGLEGYKLLVSRPVDLILCDVNMPGMNGIKLLSLLRCRPELRDIPVIMLTADGDIAQKVHALECGAKDYLVKPFHDVELVARVRVHVEVRVLQRALRQKNEELEKLVNTDVLTQLATRRHFMEVAEVEMLRAVAADTSLAVVMLDIDHFKSINDRFGHLMGDTVIRGVASVLRADLRERDVAGRFGGEEFVLVLPETDMKGAVTVAERYRKRVEALTLHDYLAAPVPSLNAGEAQQRISQPGAVTEPTQVSISLGVAAYPQIAAVQIEDLIHEADLALYQAKTSGRNRVCVARDEAG
ncbi:MAG TPA: diguanylate cyclase [Polyangiaceae bacterium]